MGFTGRHKEYTYKNYVIIIVLFQCYQHFRTQWHFDGIFSFNKINYINDRIALIIEKSYIDN